jgi:hypothetical protein
MKKNSSSSERRRRRVRSRQRGRKTRSDPLARVRGDENMKTEAAATSLAPFCVSWSGRLGLAAQGS